MDAEPRPSAAARDETPAKQPVVGWPVRPTADNQRWWICNGLTVYRQCKIICSRCGFTCDCSDP